MVCLFGVCVNVSRGHKRINGEEHLLCTPLHPYNSLVPPPPLNSPGRIFGSLRYTVTSSHLVGLVIGRRILISPLLMHGAACWVGMQVVGSMPSHNEVAKAIATV